MWGIARCTYRAAKQAVYSARIAYWAVIVWNIDETLRACAEDGLIESLSISEWNAQRDDASARIILLRAGVWA
jgi:hypothetical protein